MNKKYLAFAVVLVSVALVSAILVPYLSNTAKIKMKVDSPMYVEFSDDGEQWADNLVLPDTTGLSTVDFDMRVSNLANTEIIAPVLKVQVKTGGEGASCDDFTSIKFTDTWCHGEYSDTCPEQELVGVVPCEATEGNKVVFSIPTVKYKVGQITEYPTVLTFGNVEPSAYHFSAWMEVQPTA